MKILRAFGLLTGSILFALAASGSARAAVAGYSAYSGAELVIDEITIGNVALSGTSSAPSDYGVIIEGTAIIGLPDTAFFPRETAWARSEGDAGSWNEEGEFNHGSVIYAYSDVSGEVSGVGFANSSNSQYGLISIDNQAGSESILIDFTVDSQMSAEAYANNPVTDVAHASTSLHVYDVNEVMVGSFLGGIVAGAPGGPLDDIFYDSLQFSLEVPAGEVNNILMELSTEGHAEMVVPIPAALPLMGSAMAILGFVGWIRRKAV